MIFLLPRISRCSIWSSTSYRRITGALSYGAISNNAPAARMSRALPEIAITMKGWTVAYRSATVRSSLIDGSTLRITSGSMRLNEANARCGLAISNGIDL